MPFRIGIEFSAISQLDCTSGRREAIKKISSERRNLTSTISHLQIRRDKIVSKESQQSHTEKIAEIAAIAKATSGPVEEGFAIWWEIGVILGIGYIVVLTHIQNRVPEHEVRRHRLDRVHHR